MAAEALDGHAHVLPRPVRRAMGRQWRAVDHSEEATLKLLRMLRVLRVLRVLRCRYLLYCSSDRRQAP